MLITACESSGEYDLLYASSDDGSMSCWELPLDLDELESESLSDCDRRPPPGLPLVQLTERLAGHSSERQRSESFSSYPLTAGAGVELDVRSPLKRLSRVKTYHGHGGAIWCAGHDARTNTLVTGSYDTTIKLWDSRSTLCLRTLRGHTGWVSALALSKDPAAALVVDTSLGETEMGTAASSNTNPTGTAASSDNRNRGGVARLFTASWDRTVRMWDTSLASGFEAAPGDGGAGSRNPLLHTLVAQDDSATGFYSIALSCRGDVVMAGNSHSAVARWDIETGASLSDLKRVSSSGKKLDHVYALQVTTDGAVYAACGSAVLIFDGRGSTKQRCALQGGGGTVMCMQKDDDFRLITGCYEGTVRLWDVRYPSKWLCQFRESEPVMSLSVSDKRLLAGCSQGTIWCRYF